MKVLSDASLIDIVETCRHRPGLEPPGQYPFYTGISHIVLVIEALGVFVIVVGILLATCQFLRAWLSAVPFR